MLVDTEYIYRTKKLLVSYVDKSGNIKVKNYPWDNPMGYVVCSDDDADRHPTYKSSNGESLKLQPLPKPDRYAIYEFLDALPEDEKSEIFDYNLPKIYFIDIETEIVDGFPEAADIYDKEGKLIKEGASTQVLSISIVYDDIILLLGLKELTEESQNRIIHNTNKYFSKLDTTYRFKYIRYNEEYDMLYTFFNKMVPSMPVLTGWNFLNYDWLYLVNRARKLTKTANGREYKINPNVSSITRKLVKVMNTDFERPAHRMIFDYMMLYEIVDTSIKVKESSSLDFVSKSLIGIDKIKYTNSIYVPNGNIEIGGHHINSETIIRKVNNSEYYYYRGLDEILINEYDFLKNKHLFKEINIASLQSLYENDFETYMYYNAVDSVLVQKIHESKNYISILFAIASLAKIKVVDVISYMNGNLGTIAITEGVLRNRFRDENLILVKNNQQNTNIDTKKIKGGYVKDPIVGMNKWVVCYDFASLYPRTQMEFYISPENFVGIRDINNKSICTNGTPIDMDNHVVCINDVVFKKTKSPTLKMLEEIYADRVINKKIMMRKKEEWSSIMDEINELKMDLQLL